MRHANDPTRVLVEIFDARDATAINEMFNLEYDTVCYNHGDGDMTAEFRWEETIDDADEFASELVGRVREANGQPLGVCVDLTIHHFFESTRADQEEA